MSFYLSILSPTDTPLFEHTFGTSKQGGDGIDRFGDEARRLNPFVVHGALDIVEEAQWSSGAMYLKTVDRYMGRYVAGFVTGGNVKFLLLSTAEVATAAGAAPAGTGTTSGMSNARANAAFLAYNPTSTATEEAIKSFFLEIYDAWVKNVMNPFYAPDMLVTSPVFRQKVAGAARKYL
jgi:hypothetical protein